MNDELNALKALESADLLERLAAVEHERWAHWQRYVHDHCARLADGSLLIPAELAARWSTQMTTPYAALSEAERQSDRDQVQRYLPIIKAALNTPEADLPSESGHEPPHTSQPEDTVGL